MLTKDPRAAAALAAPLVAEEHSTHELRAVLVHITRAAGCGWPPGWTT